MSAQFRQDFAVIANWIPFGAKVLDLGCEDGSLLKFLEGSLEVKGYGIEKNDAHWLNTLKQGLNVIQMDLESGLSGFESQSFDVVVLSQTLQAMHNTETIVHEMLRVGKEAIVTFPNFGYWRHRIQLIQGQMPVSRALRMPGIRTSVFSGKLSQSDSWAKLKGTMPKFTKLAACILSMDLAITPFTPRYMGQRAACSREEPWP